MMTQTFSWVIKPTVARPLVGAGKKDAVPARCAELSGMSMPELLYRVLFAETKASS